MYAAVDRQKAIKSWTYWVRRRRVWGAVERVRPATFANQKECSLTCRLVPSSWWTYNKLFMTLSGYAIITATIAETNWSTQAHGRHARKKVFPKWKNCTALQISSSIWLIDWSIDWLIYSFYSHITHVACMHTQDAYHHLRETYTELLSHYIKPKSYNKPNPNPKSYCNSDYDCPNHNCNPKSNLANP